MRTRFQKCDPMCPGWLDDACVLPLRSLGQKNRAGTGEGTYKGGDHRRTASTFAATLEAEWRLREAGRARREVAARDHVPACPEGAAGDIPTTETIQSEALCPDDIPIKNDPALHKSICGGRFRAGRCESA